MPDPRTYTLSQSLKKNFQENVTIRKYTFICIFYYRCVRKVVAKLNRILATNRNEVASKLGHYFSDPVLKQKSSGQPTFKCLKSLNYKNLIKLNKI